MPSNSPARYPSATASSEQRNRENAWIITTEEPDSSGSGASDIEVFGKLVLDPNWCFVLYQGDVVFAAPAWRVVNVEPNHAA
jgi:hypothetical protein